MYIGYIADLHMNLSRKDNPFFVHVKDALRDFDILCDQHDAKLVIIFGDLFDTKYQVSTASLVIASDLIAQLAEKRRVIIVRGNHDTASLNDIKTNLCEVFSHYPNVTVVNEYEPIDIGNTVLHCLAYFENDKLIPMIDEMVMAENKVNLLISHIGVDEFVWHGDPSEYVAVVDAPRLRKFDKVYLGHFHGHQRKFNIAYVSSPLQSKHGDEKGQHGFMFYDTDTQKDLFVVNESSPQFITLEFNKDNIKKALQLQKHYIKFIVKQHYTKEILSTVKQKVLQNNYEVDWKFDVQSDNLQFSTIHNWEEVQVTDLDELLAGYLDHLKQLPTNTTKAELLEALLGD